MGLTGPDNRYRDSEVLLRYFAFSLFLEKYGATFKDFLDKSMERLNEAWSKFGSKVEEEYKNLNTAIQKIEVFGKMGSGGVRSKAVGTIDALIARFSKSGYLLLQTYINRSFARKRRETSQGV